MFSLTGHPLINYHKIFYAQTLSLLHDIQMLYLRVVAFLLDSVNINAMLKVNEKLKKISLPTLPQVVYNLRKNKKIYM